MIEYIGIWNGVGGYCVGNGVYGILQKVEGIYAMVLMKWCWFNEILWNCVN